MDEYSSLSDVSSETPARASRWASFRLPLLAGAIGLGAVVTTGTWVKREADARERIEMQAVRAEVAKQQEALAEFRLRFENLKWNAAKLRADALAIPAEPLKSWARERAARFEGLVIEIQRQTEDAALVRLLAEVEALCAKGEVTQARFRLAVAPAVKFPEPAEFRELHQRHYLAPLAEFSRQNPDYYRAFKEYEPEAAARDMAALREQLAAMGLETVTPQTMLGYELLSAVAPPDDPLVADWTTLASAEDFLEKPDAETLWRWRNAQEAVRAGDWPAAVAQMQAILKSTTRTRQPFRAAYAKAILRHRPDRVDEAYPHMQEAALAGDVEARAWLSVEELAKGRYAVALRWLEARVQDGEAEAMAPLVSIYARPRNEVPRDAAREAELLQKITTTPDAPPLAWMLLARLYEEGVGTERSEAKALAGYRRAAESGMPRAWLETARCHLQSKETPGNIEAAADAAARAFLAGEKGEAVSMLIDLMQRTPERAADAVQRLFEHEQTAAPAGFAVERQQVGGVAQLQALLARYLDRKGMFASAARLYARLGERDPFAAKRHAELTTARACDACGGLGKVQSSASCPACSGKGTLLCHACDGRGNKLIPGNPPCPTCSGAGGVVQEGRAVACGACNGTGKGKGSVIKQPCGACAGGRTPCGSCTGGRIQLTKDCVTCRGNGARALADL